MVRAALSDALDMAGHAAQWAALLTVAAVIVAIHGMPDTEFTGDEDEQRMD